MNRSRWPSLVEILKLVFYLFLYFILSHWDANLKGKHAQAAEYDAAAAYVEASKTPAPGDRDGCNTIPVAAGQPSAQVRECK